MLASLLVPVNSLEYFGVDIFSMYFDRLIR